MVNYHIKLNLPICAILYNMKSECIKNVPVTSAAQEAGRNYPRESIFECHWINRTNTESKLNSWEYKMFHRSWPDHSVAFSLDNCVDGCADSNGLACGQILVSTLWSHSICLLARWLNLPGYHRMPRDLMIRSPSLASIAIFLAGIGLPFVLLSITTIFT